MLVNYLFQSSDYFNQKMVSSHLVYVLAVTQLGQAFCLMLLHDTVLDLHFLTCG